MSTTRYESYWVCKVCNLRVTVEAEGEHALKGGEIASRITRTLQAQHQHWSDVTHTTRLSFPEREPKMLSLPG